MGCVYPGAPRDLIAVLCTECAIASFVETGTYMGDTASWACSIFNKVYTIENSESIYQETLKRIGIISNLQMIYGDSRDILKGIVNDLTSPALFWLDAHWSGGATYGENDECPLLAELQIISSSAVQHFIMIDDARMFLSPPTLPHNYNNWPTIAEIVLQLQKDNQYILVHDDVIIEVPHFAMKVVADYVQNINTERERAQLVRSNSRNPLKRIKNIIRRVF